MVGQTGIFGTWEQAEQQIRGFEGAQIKEFDRSDPSGIDRGLLQAKMWLRSGSHSSESEAFGMAPPADRTVVQLAGALVPVPVAPLPSTRRFSPMLLDAFHYGFFGEMCAREAEAEDHAQAASERREPYFAGNQAGRREAPCQASKPMPPPMQKRAADALTSVKIKRPRSEEIKIKSEGDLYARRYQDKVGPRNRSVMLS